MGHAEVGLGPAQGPGLHAGLPLVHPHAPPAAPIVVPGLKPLVATPAGATHPVHPVHPGHPGHPGHPEHPEEVSTAVAEERWRPPFGSTQSVTATLDVG